ncbi:MAG: ABC transporter ATP-binding protein [Nitrospira sp.]
MPHIEVQNVVKAFPLGIVDSLVTFGKIICDIPLEGSAPAAKTAVNGVSLSIGSGERVGIIGQNGAGKSTLLHLIAGIASPTSGRVLVKGHVTSVLTLGVGIREELSGRENIYVDGELQGKARSETDLVIGDIIEFAELGEFIDRPVRTYSTGMKARLAFSMIAFIDPEILLIDEALSVGDVAFSKKATRRIREICARGRIVVVVSHGLDAISEMCTRCIWMESGRIRLDGSPLEVIQAYKKWVQEIGEKEAVAKYHRHIREESYEEGWGISKLECFRNGEPWAKPLRIGESVSLRWCVHRPCGIQDFDMQLLIERLDGLLLIDERLECEGWQFAGDKVEQEVEIPTVLAQGVYRAQVGILREQVKLASRSLVFEITDPDPPKGGRPALLSSYTITAH